MKFFARDSTLWTILFYTGLVLVVTTGFIEDPEYYGIPVMVFRWMKLIVAVITAISGKLGMSLVPLKRNI